ncbi:MAG: hypothetical protein LYZ70_02385 [Nitrososphaerales archaeon]|nr:hypothetical protein [Nitrososphaerales archaeon]
MKAKCYLCDTELEAVVHILRVGSKEEPVCDECHLKTVNRQKAKQEESGEG